MAPRFQGNRDMKMVSLSTLITGRLYTQEILLVLIYSAIGRIVTMKISNDIIGNRTSFLPACRKSTPLCLPWRLIQGSRGIAPLILIVSCEWKLVANFTSGRLVPGK